jgi:rod shape-determining protein MreC
MNLKKQNFKKFFIVAVAVIGLFTALNLFGPIIRNFAYAATEPFQKAFWRAGESSSGFFQSIFFAGDLQKENNRLLQENQKLLAQVSDLQDGQKQNLALQDAQANNLDKSLAMLLTSVIGLDANSDYILIDKGSQDGISKNMPVVSAEKVLYGKVLSVFQNYSRVMLISNKDSTVDVEIQITDTAAQPISGALKGKGNLSVYLDTVSSAAQINSGQVLVTSALEGIFPKNLLAGKITSKNQSDLKPFQTAAVQPFFDIKNLDKLFVITDYKK